MYTFEIEREAILETYTGDEVQSAADYDAVCAQSGCSAATIREALGLDRRKVQRYMNGAKPRGLKGVDTLKHLGLFPMGLEAASFDLFHTLSSMVYWRGLVVSRNDTAIPTLANTVIRPSSPQQRAFAISLLEAAGISWRDINKGGMSMPNEISRLMVAAGHGIGRKSGSEGTIPEYIQKAIDSYEAGSSSAHLDLIQELVHAMIFFRIKDLPTEKRVYLYRLHDQAAAEDQLDTIHRASTIALNSNSIEARGPYRVDDGFASHIAFTGDTSDIGSIQADYAATILQRLKGSA